MSSSSQKPSESAIAASRRVNGFPKSGRLEAPPASSGAGATADCLFSTEWQPLYLAAMLEVSQRLLSDAIGIAEAALFRRMKTIFYSAEHSSERAALEQAWNALQQRKKHYQHSLSAETDRAA